jgi:hypothetical protein
MSLFPYVVITERIAAGRMLMQPEADMGLQSADAIKFCFRKRVGASGTAHRSNGLAKSSKWLPL